MTTLPIADGMLAWLVRERRPDLARRIAETGRIETAVIGLGRQGTRHAGLMREFGTTVTAAVSPEAGLKVVHETIPVYPTVAAMLAEHPDIAAVSIWKHFSTAKYAALECIEAGIPIVVLISEGMPVRDVRDVLVAAREKGTLLLGPNTPGIIFPPERVKVGMLPDVFHPAEPEPERFTAEGVTICSRSGAILYHMSDALASAGIAQNAVIGVGGDSAIGTPFPDLVPMVMDFPGTDLVVVAGEIGGIAEELLAEAIRAHPERFPKPIVALISGRYAPEGKTMGHAGAIVSPGADWGTWESKRRALEAAGVTVVNNQWDLIEAVRDKLGGRTYFRAEDYYRRMAERWDAPPPVKRWTTRITKVEPDNLVVRGVPLVDLVAERRFAEVVGLIVDGRFPEDPSALDRVAVEAAKLPVPPVPLRDGDDPSKQLAAILLADEALAAFEGSRAERVAFALGRSAAAFGRIFGHELGEAGTLGELLVRAMAGERAAEAAVARVLEACVVASVDHGVTPPSAQATILSATVRPAYEVAVASGVMAITDVHGGAGARAAEFFLECRDRAEAEGIDLEVAAERIILERSIAGERVEGMGHRVHKRDPRRDVLWRMADEAGVSGACVRASHVVERAFRIARGMSLPVNVDGVIGAIVADMGLDPRVAKAAFVLGRIAGLSAHYFEEIDTQPQMRRVDFSRAVYTG